jgi:penicillin-binding protein A
MLLIILLQFNGLQRLIGELRPLERFPAALTLGYLIGAALIVLLLLLFVVFNRRRKSALSVEADENLPDEVRKRLGARSANRALWVFRVVFIALAFAVFGFHVYWAMYAADDDPRFAVLQGRDIRLKRAAATDLRGWVLDRNGDLANTFAFWRIVKTRDGRGREDEDLVREYPMDTEMSHLLGTERGAPGLERTLFKRKDEPTPEIAELLFSYQPKPDETRDVRLTIDRELQRFAFEQLKDKKGAIVVLDPQDGDVLAVASTPTFSLNEARDTTKYHQFEANQRDKPMLSRAMREYYVPGSTFKTFTMISAFRAGRENTILTSSGGGYVPFRGSRAITDANGGCEPPYGCAPLNIAQAFEASSNQYYSQMAVELGRDRFRETAGLVGIEAVEEPRDALRVGFLSDIWNASNNDIKAGIALRQSSLVTGKDISLYDLALEGMGQGYAGQMTPFQMALIAAAAGNLNGNLMKPKIELERAPEVYNQVLTPQQSAQIRGIMGLVVEGAGGTAKVVRTIVGEDVRVGGKTGTAEKQVPVYDAKTGKPRTITKKRRDKNGNLVDYKVTVLEERTDAWFISIAPLESPKVAIAVVVEGGGYGGRTAAPIAANMIVKARSLGLLGEELRPKAAPQSQQPKNKPPRTQRRR